MQHFSHVYGIETEQAHAAKRAFASSLAAYSVVCYMLQIKDRHNGNILLDKDGHLIMIDFGWILGIAPGGAVSVEASVPFKLTTEMVEVTGGIHSGLFAEFVRLFVSGFLALQLHSDKIVNLVEIMAEHSGFPWCERFGSRRNEERQLILRTARAAAFTGEITPRSSVDCAHDSGWTSIRTEAWALPSS